MPTMDQFMSEYFTKSAGAETEELQKEAQIELFAKLASQNGIDLDSLSEAQVVHLWNSTFSKEAEETPAEEKKEEKKDEKKSEEVAAKEEFEKKKEAAAKLAEAETLGRYMAHTFVDEIKKLAAAAPAATEAAPEAKTAAAAPQVSAFERLAAQAAVTKVAQAGGDANVAISRISAVMTLGLAETEKVAHVQDFNAAVDVRALEYLEAAGYPITWNDKA